MGGIAWEAEISCFCDSYLWILVIAEKIGSPGISAINKISDSL